MKKYILLHLLLFFFSFCSVFSKLAASYEFLSWQFCLFYGISIMILGIYAVLWQQIIKKMPLVIAFLNKAVTIIWGMIWGTLIFSEKITLNMIIGCIVVIIGVVMVVKE